MNRRHLAFALAAAAMLAVGAGALVSSARSTTGLELQRPIAVTVTDGAIRLDRRSVQRGDVGVFLVRNAGRRPHNFIIGIHHTRVLPPGGRATLVVDFGVRETIPYRTAVYSTPGMTGRFRVL